MWALRHIEFVNIEFVNWDDSNVPSDPSGVGIKTHRCVSIHLFVNWDDPNVPCDMT